MGLLSRIMCVTIAITDWLWLCYLRRRRDKLLLNEPRKKSISNVEPSSFSSVMTPCHCFVSFSCPFELLPFSCCSCTGHGFRRCCSMAFERYCFHLSSGSLFLRPAANNHIQRRLCLEEKGKLKKIKHTGLLGTVNNTLFRCTFCN